MNHALSAPLFLSEETPGIFESLRSYEGTIFRVEEHPDRFFESAQTLGIKIPETRAQLKTRLEKALRDSGKKEAFLRLTLITPLLNPLPRGERT